MDKDIRILVADDLEAMRYSVRTILSHLGFEHVAEAEDGRQALDILRSGSFDFLIADIDMPHMDGIALLRAIRADDALKHLPVLFVTGEGEKGRVLEAAQAGVNDYVLKPFTVDVLERKIEKIFGQ